jgi:hypothetical protein
MVRRRLELGLIRPMGGWRATVPMTKFPRKICIVSKATSVRDFADRLAYTKRFSATQKARSLFQAKRVYEFTAGRTSLRK